MCICVYIYIQYICSVSETPLGMGQSATMHLALAAKVGRVYTRKVEVQCNPKKVT